MMIAYAVWGMYGCDTGCDGYRLTLETEEGEIVVKEQWSFSTIFSGEDPVEFVKELVEDTGYGDVTVDLDRCEFMFGGN